MNSRFWWVWFIGLTFLLTWGVLYVGYMVDDRVYDSVVVFVQAVIVTLLATLVVILFVPRARGSTTNSRSSANHKDGRSTGSAAALDTSDDNASWDNRNDPVLPAHPIPIQGSHHLDLRGLTITLLEMMALAERYDRNLTLVLMAVDDIDVVREEYGERAVTRVMAEVADVLSDALRIPDRSGVYADNRFLVVLPETNVESGRQIAERVRRQVVDTEVRIDARRRISVTVSAGVTGFKSGDDPQSILDRVENALAEARLLGSNHSIVWSAPASNEKASEGQDDERDSAIDVEVDETAKLH